MENWYNEVMKKLLVGVIVLVAIIIVSPSHIFGKLDILKKIQGYHLESDYYRQSPFESQYTLPGMYLTETKTDVPGSLVEVATYKDIANKYAEYKSKFSVGDNVSFYNHNDLDNGDGTGTINIIKYSGVISAIDENYIPENKVPSIKYGIKLSDSSKINSIQTYVESSMVNTIEDGKALIIDHNLIRNIDGKKYVCVITDKIAQDQFMGGSTFIIKYGLKEVKTGIRTYMQSDGVSYQIEVTGISPKEEVVGTPGLNNPNGFDCGSTQ
jgi:hypothetical protein